MTIDSDTQLPVRGASLARMLISLAAAGAQLAYWASHQNKPAQRGFVIINPMYCQCYDEQFPSGVTVDALPADPFSKLLPEVQSWLKENPERLRECGVPRTITTDYNSNRSGSQWVYTESGQWTRFYVQSGAVIVVAKESADGSPQILWSAPNVQ